MKQKCRYAYVIFCIMVFICFIGCEPTFYHYNNIELYTIAAYSIPYVDEMGTKIEVLEKDSYDRVLFQVQFGSNKLYTQSRPVETSNTWMYAYVISQKVSNEKVYYYEDECFQLYYEKEAFTESELNQLKDRNDWNRSIDEDRLISKTILSPDVPKGYKSFSPYLMDLFNENASMKQTYVFSEFVIWWKGEN